MEVSTPRSGVCVAVPHLPSGTAPREAETIQRRLLDELLAAHRVRSYILWYYTPMAMPFSRASHSIGDRLRLHGRALGLRGRAAGLQRSGRASCSRGPTWSSPAARASTRRSAASTPTSTPSRAASMCRTSRRARQIDSASPPTRRQSRIRVSASSASSTSGWICDLLRASPQARPTGIRDGGPVVKIDPAALPQRSEHPLPRRQEHTRAAGVSRGLGCGAAAVRAQRGDALHQPDQDARSIWRRASRSSRPRSGTSCAPTASRGWCASPRRSRDFVAAVEEALREDPTARMQRADAFLAQSWDRTWERMCRLIEDVIEQPPRTARCVSTRSQSRRRADSALQRREMAMFDYLIVGRGIRRAACWPSAWRPAGQEGAHRDRAPAHRRQCLRPLRRRGILVHTYGPHIFHTNARAHLRVPVAVHRVASLRAPRAGQRGRPAAAHSRSIWTPSTSSTA